jgi:hypothetical protein
MNVINVYEANLLQFKLINAFKKWMIIFEVKEF